MTAIDDKYLALGGGAGLLGMSIGVETATSDGIGRFRHYHHGSIYWHPQTQAHRLGGPIAKKWTELGAERSFLGYPISDETATADPKEDGRFAHFQNGSMYWRPDTGAHEVRGPIRDRWMALGAEQSALGFPISDESATGDGKGRFTLFQGGRIEWRPETGARWSGKTALGEPQPPEQLEIMLTRLGLHESRVKLVQARLAERQKEGRSPGGRAQSFYPYLLIRSVVGDHGDRPLDPNRIPATVSPDIWVRRGFTDPLPRDAYTPTPDDPALLVGDAPVTQLRSIAGTDFGVAPYAHGFHEPLLSRTPYTVYAQVWNLGRAPIVGARVEFHYACTWVNALAHFSRPLGVGRVDLAPRTSTQCHQFVRCPVPLIPELVNRTRATEETHTLIVRVSSVGDSVEDAWNPSADRHVAFRTFTVK